MLAKIWKKLLLAICIIAILFNITAKLVNRISLEKAISSAPEGVNLREVLNITEEQRTITPKTEQKKDNVSRYKTVEEVEAERAAQAAAEAEQEQEQENETRQIEVQPLENNAEMQETEAQEETKQSGSSIIDMVTDSLTNVQKYEEILR